MLSHCLRRLSTSHPGTAACCSAVVQLLSRSCLNPALPDPCTAQSRALNVLQYNDRAAVVARSLGLAQPAALQQTCQHVTTAAVPGWASRSYATRLGFGIKVALPARDVLRQEVVSGADGPVEVTLRAYHVGESSLVGSAPRLFSIQPSSSAGTERRLTCSMSSCAQHPGLKSRSLCMHIRPAGKGPPVLTCVLYCAPCSNHMSLPQDAYCP
jgi:hypothetical protein